MDVTAPRPAPAATRASPADAPSAVVIRPLASLPDYRACVALQREIWGDAFEVVPAAILQVTTHVGGVALGAFDQEGQLVGFVFGLSGVDGGKAIHWSHILGVRPELRDAGIGRRLKEYQRQELERRHIGEMYWTYDPLIAKNAHFNLNVLGARVLRYAPDMYGETGSPLHHGLATDRLVVRCDTARPPREASATLDAFDAHTPVLTPHPQPGDAVLATTDSRSPRLRIEVPADFAQLLVDSPAGAKAWHLATREHFQWALGHDYVVTGFRRDPVTSRAFYMLERHHRQAAPAT
jgi:predicted GNAT superfamily acetyltransferase